MVRRRHRFRHPRPRGRRPHDDASPYSSLDVRVPYCPVCWEQTKSTDPNPIQCRNGHMICFPCSKDVDTCYTCNVPMDPKNPIVCLVARHFIEYVQQRQQRQGQSKTATATTTKKRIAGSTTKEEDEEGGDDDTRIEPKVYTTMECLVELLRLAITLYCFMEFIPLTYQMWQKYCR